MSAKVVVTGGAGFIGSHLAEELLTKGYAVTIVDNLSTGKIENIEGLRSNNNFSFTEGSVSDLSLLSEIFNNTQYVFHLAAMPSVTRSVDNPRVSHETNLTGTLNVLIAARDNHVSKVVMASSSSVYGDTPTLPKREDMFPNPLSPYAVTKLASEYYCQVFHECYELSTICLRYFNVFGPKQDPLSQYAAVIPIFTNMVLHEQSPVIYGDGEQTRDFTFIRDVTQATILAAESNANGVFNIGGGTRTSINQLTEHIINIIGKNVKPVHKEPRPGDVKHSLADILKAKTFGYEPKYDLLKGLKETIKSFQNEGYLK